MYITKTRSGYVIRSQWYRPSWKDADHKRPMHAKSGNRSAFVQWQEREYRRWLDLRAMAKRGERLSPILSGYDERLQTAACYFPQTLPLPLAEAAE